MTEADDYLPLSALQHVIYCERQFALIHVDRIWLDDQATATGHVVHERVHEAGADARRGVTVARAVALRSTLLRVFGYADMVEYSRDGSGALEPMPVEVKSGRRKALLADHVQLCAQAMCLEEWHDCAIERAAVYYAASHRRVYVELDESLRATTFAAAQRSHALMAAFEVPAPIYESRKCDRCSLLEACMPIALADRSAAGAYLVCLSESNE